MVGQSFLDVSCYLGLLRNWQCPGFDICSSPDQFLWWIFISSNHFLAFKFLFSLLFFKTSFWSFFHFSFINYWSKHKKKRVLIIFGRFPLMICLLANPVIWNCTSVSWRLLFSHVCKLSSGRASSLSGHERFGGKSWGLCEVGTYTQHKLPAFKFVFLKEKKKKTEFQWKKKESEWILEMGRDYGFTKEWW